MAPTQRKIEANLHRIRANIEVACAKANRHGDDVRVIAVTKSVDEEIMRRVVAAGVSDLGESRVQQLTSRAEALNAWNGRRRKSDGPLRWHMIGHLQRNKVKAVVDLGAVVHSVDTLRLAEEIQQHAAGQGRIAEVLLQVNCGEEEQKFGVAVGAAVHLGEMVASLSNVRLVGLMTMAPRVEDPEQARPVFQRLAEIFEEMSKEGIGGEHFRHLSMGMSQDYIVAVEEGATMVRIGRALLE